MSSEEEDDGEAVGGMDGERYKSVGDELLTLEVVDSTALCSLTWPESPHRAPAQSALLLLVSIRIIAVPHTHFIAMDKPWHYPVT